MQNAKPIHYLQLHFIVLLWGFSGVLGKLISFGALQLVWYRLGIASLVLFLYTVIRRKTLKIPKSIQLLSAIAGITIAVHWIFFFYAIKISNVSITLACMSTGAFMTAILEPIWYKRKMVLYELLLGLLVIIGLAIILEVQFEYLMGVISALIAALLSSVYSLINGQLIKKASSNALVVQQLFIGFLFLSVILWFNSELNIELLSIDKMDLTYVSIIAVFCTAYAIKASTELLKYISPYSMILTLNMEPIYGIILAVLIFKESEKMPALFYLGALIILISVVLDVMVKFWSKKSQKQRLE
ncbi:MAG: DMT family transporter [Flavobacteriaceae bacterium]|jgi:drug/metabolite transporter (DMT)-like permease|nr:DMT family transporter [Flavobacteriaceae bacterium]NVJ72970.1 DMT family transporter [Flavobacteriaceae bacterium]